MSAKPPSPPPHHVKSLKRKNFHIVGDLIVDGDVQIAENLIVAGDLVIRGDCRVNNLYCLGHATINGNVHFGSIHILGVLECFGDATGENLLVATEPMAVFDGMALAAPVKAALAYFHERQADELFMREKYAYASGGGKMVNIAGDLKGDTLQIEGSLAVGGDLSFDGAVIHGSSLVVGCATGNSLEMSGTSYIEKRLTVHRKLYSSCDITCSWSCIGGDIEVKGDLDVRHAIVASGNLLCSGHIKSDNRIQVRGMVVALKSIQAASSIFAGKGIQAGEDYGIFAGMSVPDSLLSEHGYIAAPSKPKRIRSGRHIADKRFKKLSLRQLVQWPADDGSDRVY